MRFHFHFRDLRKKIIKRNYKFCLDRYKDVDGITYQETKIFMIEFFKNLHIKMLIEGNLLENHAKEIAEKFSQNFPSSPKKPNQKLSQINEVPIGTKFLKVRSMSNDENSLMKNYYQIGKSNVEDSCLLEIIDKMMKEPLYTSLRTRQQIGYSVSCAMKKDEDFLGFVFNVKFSEKRFSPNQVDEKFDEFLIEFSQQIEQMSDEEFKLIKNSVRSGKFDNFSSKLSEFQSHFREITENCETKFDREIIEARQIELLQKNDVINFFNHHFKQENRRKISIQILAHDDKNYESLLKHGYLHLDILDDKSNK